jgi:two-component system, NarL family, nitrate/nitrite response regulator NarL
MGSLGGPMGRAITVIVADDEPHVVHYLEALLQAEGFDVAGAAFDADGAVQLVNHMRPDVALLDLRMPGMDGLALLARLRHREPPVAVAVLSAYTDSSLVHSAMAAGACAYITKECDRAEILDVVFDVALGRRRVRIGQRPGTRRSRAHGWRRASAAC